VLFYLELMRIYILEIRIIFNKDLNFIKENIKYFSNLLFKRILNNNIKESKMARKHYSNESIMKFLTIIGGLVGLAFCILGLLDESQYHIYAGLEQLRPVIGYIIGIVISVLTIYTGIRPDDPIPFHWLVLFILGILLIVFGGGIWACALLIIASLLGIIDEL